MTRIAYCLRSTDPDLECPTGSSAQLGYGQARPVTIDYAAGTLTLETAGSLKAQTVDMRKIPQKVSRKMGGDSVEAFTQIMSHPEPLWFYMDSANLRGILAAPHAAEVMNLGPDGGPINLEIGRVAYQRNAEVAKIIYDGVLDVTFFLDHVITLDLVNERAWIRKNAG